MKHIVHENGYHEMNANELKELFEGRAIARTYEDYMKAFCNRKYNSDFSREMSRSVRSYLRDFSI